MRAVVRTSSYRRASLLGLAFLGALLLALLTCAGPAAPAADAKLKRHENRYWVWYAPGGWTAAWGRAGIDITSPTGVLYVGQGFSGTAFPVTHREVIDYLLGSGALDVHPLRRVRIIRSRKPAPFGGGVRQKLQWKAFRTDRRERVRGTLLVDVFSDHATRAYGFASTVYVAPKRKWRKKKRKLRKVSKTLFYKPQTPDFGF